MILLHENAEKPTSFIRYYTTACFFREGSSFVFHDGHGQTLFPTMKTASNQNSFQADKKLVVSHRIS